jgi:hypothetical protein
MIVKVNYEWDASLPCVRVLEAVAAVFVLQHLEEKIKASISLTRGKLKEPLFSCLNESLIQEESPETSRLDVAVF